MKKALIAMSGGVDSSLVAKLMRDRGYDCIGCTMKLYNNEDAGIESSRTCCSLDDVEDARSIAYKQGKILGQRKGIIHYTIGQRKGLGIPSTELLYVRGICP